MAVLSKLIRAASFRSGFHGNAIVLVVAFCLWATPKLPAQSVSKEYEIKAVFLFNFTQFVSWPSSAFVNASSTMTIGILGDDPFGNSLEEAIRGEKANGRELVIRRFHQAEEIKDCQVLFISDSES
jgi:hypothetical protein